MSALASCWTWIGCTFVPVAIGWVIFLRGGLSEQPPALGVLISRGYAGLLVSLVAGCALIWILALYVRAARKIGLRPLIPPNTMFEKMDERNEVISWATLAVFLSVLLAALVMFSVRYSESNLHGWNDRQPLASGFWASRVKAQSLGCASQPCFSMSRRIEGTVRVTGVYEYIFLVTDGVLVLFVLLLLAGIWFLVLGFRQPKLGRIDL